MKETVGLAATGIFSASGEYLMSDYDTPEIAELRALDYARKNAAEQAGIYLESHLRSVEFDEQGIKVKKRSETTLLITTTSINTWRHLS